MLVAQLTLGEAMLWSGSIVGVMLLNLLMYGVCRGITEGMDHKNRVVATFCTIACLPCWIFFIILALAQLMVIFP